ncbi:hypothetical protein [Methanocella arvoryzae]|uniref:Uncharacterized protein n=1 Tax=Methanocella arvoryzae (strain DSM 22066 / NBRC 105507 / MRE50) TaxID=351160 RepID=Q0W0S7_METAR|nr:hypothetical protein [Methanocella arvoryzae]CAJ38016.1 hypothetical protein RRC281 [Methanocella arvoryzae MRE50]
MRNDMINWSKILCVPTALMLLMALTVVPTVATNTTSDEMVEKKLKIDPAVVDKATHEFLSGKTDKLVIPGAIIDTTPAKKPNDTEIYPELPLPIQQDTNTTNGLMSIQSSGLQVNPSYNSNWDIIYMVFGINSKYVSSCGARVYNLNNLQDANAGDFDEYVMHLYGYPVNNQRQENCIQMIRDGNNIRFNIMVDYNFVDHWDHPSDHTYSLMIKANNAAGSRDFNSITYGILDMNTGDQYYRTFNTPHTQQCDLADMAIEKYYYHDGYDNDLPPSVSWKAASDFYCYDYNNRIINLINGEINSLTTGGTANAWYYDFYDYLFNTNGKVNLYMTRYNPATPYPAHP